MNPNRGESEINFELPQPGSPETDNQRTEKGAEAPAAAPEQAGKQPPQPVLPAIPDDIPAVDKPIIAVPPQDAAAGHPASDHSAQDVERIEPEWVNKAKAIISQTHDDPYMQKSEMSKVKAEYIQKRFNKQIKTDEAPA